MPIVTDCRVELESLGGRYVKDPEGDYWLFEVGEFFLEVEPFATPFSGGLTIGVESSVSHKGLSAICNRILDEDAEARQGAFWWQDQHDLGPSEHPCESLKQIVEDVLTRARSIDLPQHIRVLAATCPDRPSMRQVLHLAALAYLGEFSRLLEYLETFERGKRLNFVPMITSAMLSRAFDISVDNG